MVTDAQRACFEAGVKFGSLYHQFAGAPVSPASVDSLATAMAESIENQPFCESVTVSVRAEALDDAVAAAAADYVEFTGRFVDVDVVVVHEGIEVVAEMRMQDGYPLMEPVSVSERG